MPIPDWVWRETKHIHVKAYHVLSAVFMEGRAMTLEDGTQLMALAEEWPLESGLVAEEKTQRTVWAQLQRRGLVEYQAKDHIALSGRPRGSYLAPLQDPIRKFSYVPNGKGENFPFPPAGAPLPDPEFESEARRLSRAYARDNNMRTCAGGDSTATPTTPTTPTTASPAATAPVAMPSLEEALQLIGFSEEGQADELIRGFGFNSTAVAVRYLVRGLRGAARGKQPPISSKTGYVIQYLGANRKVQFAEVEDFGFLVDLVRLLRGPCPDGRVIEFPARGEA